MKAFAKLFVLILLVVFSVNLLANPKVEMAILLDTSGSMEGLIEQAKSQLWQIVNELAISKRDGQPIDLYIALYEYGKDSIPESEGYIRMIVPLSQDLDKISEELFVLKTNGGNEYCGRVIQSAVNSLQWSEDNNDLKLIFIAGNEPFTQGKIKYKDACQKAIENGIIVNTIFCGDFQEGIDTFWKDGADLADGKYMNIDHNMQLVQIDAPQDEELFQLSQALNDTYIAYGIEGEMYKERQEEQDSNALSMGGGTYAARTMSKSSAQYKNTQWDMVDAEEEGAVNLQEIPEDQLPEEMKNMSLKERKAYVEEKAAERKRIQEKITQISAEREKYITQERAKLNEKSLDSVIIDAIHEQAAKKNYKFE
ncbi:MAG: VWA domain-containing protein [Candidatus Cloacimonetes bacterium]|nr:VWA domain-containing protein [Candidatus Cloacimonadota bacterium]MCF7813352.1 VWA domain-containing protein [Candidatus Cloacimonadota bacterium]MCF7867841.1 VWA domain-containing protein [Candidatus Cloacimonadota bacterium]MCF7883273.1 VWA domain-containing protein [Candidatus Cloacimonadota bacterium]